jgi:hypothetical protein
MNQDHPAAGIVDAVCTHSRIRCVERAREEFQLSRPRIEAEPPRLGQDGPDGTT